MCVGEIYAIFLRLLPLLAMLKMMRDFCHEIYLKALTWLLGLAVQVGYDAQLRVRALLRACFRRLKEILKWLPKLRLQRRNPCRRTESCICISLEINMFSSIMVRIPAMRKPDFWKRSATVLRSS